MRSIVLISLVLLCCSLTSRAQQGTLTGTVTDQLDGTGIPGATVFITGSTKATATDVNGKYTLKLEPGTYNIRVSYISYKAADYQNIRIEPNKVTTLNIKIQEDTKLLETVTIVGTRVTNSEVALISDLKKSEIVVSGVSGQQIAKSMDRDAGEVVKRIPGVSIMNNRFIMVRGLSERYNTVMLNDALTPSSEVDVKAFSFDILPTSVIDRILIYKSGAPELPGEFAGGVIKIYTKNFADENSTSFSLSTSYRAGTTLRTFNRYDGGKTDFLGFDDGTRALPGSFPQHLSAVSRDQLDGYGKSLSNTWLPTAQTAAPDLRMNFGMARKFTLGQMKLSNITSVAYSNTRTAYIINRNRYLDFNPETGKSPVDYAFRDQQSDENVRLGIIHNWGLRINERHRIEFRNLFNQLGINQVTIRTGQDVTNGSDLQNYSLRFESRSIYSGQLQGTHQSASENTTYSWTAGYNYTNRNEPDFRRSRTQRPTGTDEAYQVVIPPGANPLDGRFFSGLSERGLLTSGQVEHQLPTKDSASENRIKLRSGYYVEHKTRDFDARWMSYRKSPVAFNQSLASLPLDQIFAQHNINSTTGFELVEGTNPSDRYAASNLLAAGFVGASLPLGEKIKLSGGFRTEYNRQQLSSGTFGGQAVEVDNPITSMLPSVNASYNFNKRSLLRAAYSRTINRPEFRELAPFNYYDFLFNAEWKGNPELKTPVIDNAELRYELYPNPTELITIGVFYKHFLNPIESVITPSSGANTFTFANATESKSAGIETEIRKSLLDLSAHKWIQNTSLVLNASVIQSRVELNDEQNIQESNRPMMGQSPYIVNAGIYHQTDNGWQMNLLYNVTGKRIFIVGNYANPTIYELPRHQVDLTVSRKIGERLELKGGIQDLFNQSVKLVQDSDRNRSISGTDESIATYRRGIYTTLGLNYTF
jgi:outer membrane receptor for ferrienterochelin and colicin